jgi:CheY-like chemotaxis protein
MGKPNILLVDTTSFSLDLQKRILRGRFPKIEIYTATTGKQAQQTLQKYSIDLILCEWEIPEISGAELATWLRANNETKHIPIIMLTNQNDKAFIASAIKEGAVDYIPKPFSPETFLQKVVKALQKTGYQDNYKAQQDAVSLLTGGAKAAAKPAPPITPVAAAEFARNAPTTENTEAPKQKIVAQLKLAEKSLPCVVKMATLNEIQLGASRQVLPVLFETVTVTLTHPNTQQATELNGYIHLLQIASHDPQAQFINIAVRFLNNDADKMEALTQFIAALPKK